jgi:peptidyl-prolyl cis-trans isomerase D
MISFFHRLSRSWFGPAIMGVMVVALGFLGLGSARSLFGASITNAVIQAGSRSVGPSQFQKMFQRNEQAYQERTGQSFPLEQMLKEGADKGMVQDLAAQTAYFEMLGRAGIRPSDDVVASELRRQAQSGQAPGLAQIFDAVTGKFRPEALQELLKNNGITLTEFQHELGDTIADGDFTSAVHEGYRIPRIYAAVQAALLLEGRDVTYFVIPTTAVPVPPPPTDAQLTALMQQHHDQLMLPERRKFTVVRFSAKTIAPTLAVDPKAVEQQFEAKKASYSKPELRSFVEIALNDPRQAAAVSAAMSRGADPATVAKSLGVQAIPYVDQPRSAVVDAKAGDAVFAMKEGAVSGPVQGDFKTVVLKLIKITPAQAPDLNAARAQIEADLRQAQAVDKVYDLTQKFEDLRQGGASTADAAAKLGVQALVVGPVPADGKDPLTGQVDPALTPKLLANAFQLRKGEDGDVQQDGDKGEYFAVRVDQVVPPSLPSLDEPGIRVLMTRAFMEQAVVTALQQKGAEAEAALKQGKAFETVAAGYGAKVAHQVGLQRGNAQQYVQTFGQDFLAIVFGQKAGAYFTVGSNALNGFVVGHLDAVRPADSRQVAQVLELLRQRGSQSYLEGLQQATREASVKLIKPSTNLKLARDAMGVDPAMAERYDKAAAAPASSAGAKPAK